MLGNKLSPGPGSVEGEQESGAAAGRKRRWGSSAAVTAKKPSISITTDSLKVLAACKKLYYVVVIIYAFGDGEMNRETLPLPLFFVVNVMLVHYLNLCLSL